MFKTFQSHIGREEVACKAAQIRMQCYVTPFCTDKLGANGVEK
jgi:hypothetical protein